MGRNKKIGADAVQENALGLGHNHLTSKEEAGFCGEFKALEEKRLAIVDKQKGVLQRAKDAGMLKGGIRAAVKKWMASEEQRQAKDAVEQAREQYLAACREEGLFVPEEMAEHEEEAA